MMGKGDKSSGSYQIDTAGCDKIVSARITHTHTISSSSMRSSKTHSYMFIVSFFHFLFPLLPPSHIFTYLHFHSIRYSCHALVITKTLFLFIMCIGQFFSDHVFMILLKININMMLITNPLQLIDPIFISHAQDEPIRSKSFYIWVGVIHL